MPVKYARKTSETQVSVSIGPSPGISRIETPSGFFSHMLELLAHNSGWSLDLDAKGREGEDLHHMVEDVGIALGRALLSWYPESPRARYGWCAMPMDGSLVLFSADLSGRGGSYFKGSFPTSSCGGFDMELIPEFFAALAREARITIHIRIIEADNSHHTAEAVFKAAGRVLAQAMLPSQTEPSSKGIWP